jgi:DNA-binding IclR family transcriptional regulator
MSSPDALNSNRTLARAASILDAVDGEAASATELAKRSGLSVSTAHRLALSLVEYGFLRRTEAGEFRLGHRFVRTAMEQAALPRLAELKGLTGETVQLWVRRGDERVCLLSVDSDQELKASLPPGSRLPLPEGSSGRLLAADPEALAAVEQHGWVESVGVRTPGLGSVSAPVTVKDRLIATVCLAVPLSRVSDSPGQDFGPAVVAAARRIAADLEQTPNA